MIVFGNREFFELNIDFSRFIMFISLKMVFINIFNQNKTVYSLILYLLHQIEQKTLYIYSYFGVHKLGVSFQYG